MNVMEWMGLKSGLSNKDWETLRIYMIEYEWFSI